MRRERGPTRVALETKDPADVQMMTALPALRATGVPALEATLTACADLDCGGDGAIATIGTLMRSVAALRKEVDTALPVPLAQRRPGLAKESADATNGLGDALERVSLGFTDQIRMADPVFAELMATKETSLLVHDVARLERTSMTAALAAKEVSPELRTRIIDLRGKGDAGWRLLHNLIVSVEKVLAEGTAPPMSVGEFVKASSDLLDVLASIPSAAVDAALARAAAQSAEGRANWSHRAACCWYHCCWRCVYSSSPGGAWRGRFR